MKKTKLTAMSLLLALAMLLVSSCSTIEAVELSAEYERTATETGSVSEDFITKLTALSFKMFSEITTEDEDKANLLFSPLSAAVCIAMITNGADGETLAELEELFGMDIDTLNKSIYAYVASLYTSDDCKLSLSNSIWVRNTRITVKETFLQTNADWYGADAYSAPFDSSTVDDINKWCRDSTDGLINKIIDEIPQDAVAYLINSLLFDAKWMSEYDDDDMIENATFTNYDATTSEVTLMDSIESQYLTYGTATGVMKYYSGYSYAFAALLPDEETDVYEFAASLTGESWLEMLENKKSTTVYTRIPEFSYSYEKSLKDVLMALGVDDIFYPDTADLSNLGTSTGGNIFLSSIVQKTYIDVSQNGTKAAAITWGGASDSCAAPNEEIEVYYVYLDRPFVYAIIDIDTGIPLFVGVYSSAE